MALRRGQEAHDRDFSPMRRPATAAKCMRFRNSREGGTAHDLLRALMSLTHRTAAVQRVQSSALCCRTRPVGERWPLTNGAWVTPQLAGIGCNPKVCHGVAGDMWSRGAGGGHGWPSISSASLAICSDSSSCRMPALSTRCCRRRSRFGSLPMKSRCSMRW